MAHVCALCRSALVATPPGWSCTSCAAVFPVLHGDLPVLVADPDLYLADQILGTQVIEIKTQRALAMVDQARAMSTRRADALARMRVGIATNLALVGRWRRALLACSESATRLASGMRSSAHGGGATAAIGALRYLISDWGRTPEHEAVIDAIVTSVRTQLAPYPRAEIVVMGGGAGRLAIELTRDSERVHLIDLSAAMALSYRWITTTGLTVHHPIEMNVEAVADLYPALPLVGTTPPRDRPADPARVTYVLADALRMPFADASLDATLSVYLTDVVDDLPALLREVRRVLRPGGVFLHFGTLGYSTFKPDAMWTAAELRELLAEHGLVVSREEWVEHRLWPSHSLVQMAARAWSVVAVKAP